MQPLTRITLSLALFVVGGLAHAQAPGKSCAPVQEALAKLAASRGVHIRGVVLAGHHPERYTTMESIVVDQKWQVRILDGTRYGPGRIDPRNDELGRANATDMLAPLGECSELPDKEAAAQGQIKFGYSAPAGRTDALIQLWIDRSSGLPVRALLDGPELILGRSLSRPTKPPQVMLKENGQRYLERLDFVTNHESIERMARRLGMF